MIANGTVRTMRKPSRAEEVLQRGVVRALYGCGENKAPLPSRWNTLSGVHPTAHTANFVGGAVADGVVVIDIEGLRKQAYYRHLSEEQWAEMMERVRLLMEGQPYVVYTASTPSGGLHIGIKVDERLRFDRSVRKVNALGLQFDLLPAGNNIIIAGDGRTVYLLRPVADAPAFDPKGELIPLLLREIPQAGFSDEELFRPDPFTEGSRNESLYRYLRALKARGVFGNPLSDEVSDIDLELAEAVLPYRCKPYYDEEFPSHALTQTHTLDFEEALEKWESLSVFDHNRRLLRKYMVSFNGERLRWERERKEQTPAVDEDTDFAGWMTVLPATEVKRMVIADDTDLFSFLRREHITLLHAPAKTGKSTFAYQLAESLAWGIPFAPLGETPTKQCKVLYIDLENDYRHIQNKLWLPSDNLQIARVNPQQLMLLTPDNLYHLLRHQLSGGDFDVVIFDNIFRVSGIDLNKAEDVSRVMMMFEGVAREFGCAVFLIHHSREDAMGTFKAFGSVVFQNIPAFILELRRVPDTNQAKLKIRGRGEGDVQVLLDYRDGRYFPCHSEAVSSVEKQMLQTIAREGEVRIDDLLSLYTRPTLRAVFSRGLVRKVGDRVKLTAEGKNALLPDEQHPVWSLYSELRHLPELPVPFNNPLFVFWYYGEFEELPTAEDYEQYAETFTGEQAVAPEQEPSPDPATPATPCEPSDDGDDDPDDTPPSGTFSHETPYVEDEMQMTEIETLFDLVEGLSHSDTSRVHRAEAVEPAEPTPSAHSFPADAVPSEPEQIAPVEEPTPATPKTIVWHILEDPKKRVVYLNGKRRHTTFRVLEKRGEVMKVVERGEGFKYDEKRHFICPQSVLGGRFFEKYEPIAFDDLIIGTLDVETPTLQSGDDAEILVVGAGVRYPDGSVEDAYFDDIYSALMWLKRKGIHILVGHNLFGYDMRLRPSEWERAGGMTRKASFRQEQNEYKEYTYYAFPEFAVVDTFLLSFKAEQMGIFKPEERGLHNLARLLGVAEREQKAEWGEIHTDIVKVRERLRGDLLEAIAVFRAMWKNLHPILRFVPVGVQDLFLKSTGSLVCYILINEALRLGEPIPAPKEKEKYEGALVYANTAGVYYNIITADVASLYPSIMLQEEGCSHPLARAKLKELTELRLHYKRLAKQGDAEANALQNALKILINSFYGFYGTGGLPFNDIKIASAITAKGRELLSKMMERASARGTVVEADTDGIIVSLPAPPTADDHRFFEGLLREEGYTIETSQYDACLLRAMKNYSLFIFEDGEWKAKVVKGSSQKSRARTDAVLELTRLLLNDFLTQQFSVERTVEHIHRLLYEHHKHIKSEKVSEASRERRATLLSDADILGSRFYYYFTVGTTKTGKYSYSQKGTARVSGRGAKDEMTAPPNLQKHAEDLLNVVQMYADIIGKDIYGEIKQRVKALIPPVSEWVRIWEQTLAREA
jgi:hypothetical protein